MSTGLASFIPSNVMGAMVLTKLRKQLVAADAVSNDYRGILLAGGDSIKVPYIETSGATAWTRGSTITYNGLGSTSTTLSVNQEYMFAYNIDSVDSRQSPANIIGTVFNQAVQDLLEQADTYVLQTAFGDAGVTAGSGDNALGTSGTAIDIYKTEDVGSGAYSFLGRLSTRLDEVDVPQDQRFVIVPPWFAGRLTASKVLETFASEADYANGRVGRCRGFDVRVSTNLPGYSATTNSVVYAGRKSAAQFVDNLQEAEILKLEQTFGTGVRGLYVWGCKVMNSLQLAKAWVDQA